jgi:hypothetical protein
MKSIKEMIESKLLDRELIFQEHVIIKKTVELQEAALEKLEVLPEYIKLGLYYLRKEEFYDF